LQQHAQKSSLVSVRRKAQAVLMNSEGVSSDSIAVVVDRSTYSIDGWIRSFLKTRMASIFTGHKDNSNAAKLTKAQLQQIKETLSSPPSDYGMPKEMWDVPALKEYVSATFGVVYESPESYYFILRFSGLSFKYPDTFDRKRDEVFISERMKAIAVELAPLLEDSSWEVFASDEVRMDQESIIRKAWLKKGERTIIKVDRKKQSQSYIGFLNQKSFNCHLYEIQGMQNTKNILPCIEQFLKLYPNKKIAIVWDNAPWHKSKELRDQLRAEGILNRVHLIAMPPYAPDNNPIEHVWNTTKQAVSNIQHETFEQTKQAFSDFVASRQFKYSF
jgi:transposase